jgi:hypothetical protein
MEDSPPALAAYVAATAVTLVRTPSSLRWWLRCLMHNAVVLATDPPADLVCSPPFLRCDEVWP